MRSLDRKPCRNDRAIARFEIFLIKIKRSSLKSCLLYGFLLCFYKPVLIGPRAKRENTALQLANQSVRYIGHRNKPYNKCIFSFFSLAESSQRDLQITVLSYIIPSKCVFLQIILYFVMNNCNHVLVLKMADRFPKMLKRNLNMKTNLLIE